MEARTAGVGSAPPPRPPFPAVRCGSAPDVASADLARLAAALPAPIEHGAPVRAYCTAESTPGPKLGLGVHRFRVAWGFDLGRQLEAVGPAFADPKDACRLAALLNARSVRQPEPAEPARTCVVCGAELPAGSRAHRAVCSGLCRVRRFRARQAAPGRAPRRAPSLRRANGQPPRNRYTAPSGALR